MPFTKSGGPYLLFIFNFKTMKNSLLIAAIAVLTFTACKKNEDTTAPTPQTEEIAPAAASQDSAVKAHGHSHDAPSTEKDSATAGHGHSHDTPAASKDTTGAAAHGHAH